MLSFWASYLLGLGFFLPSDWKENWNAALWWCCNTYKRLFSGTDQFNTFTSVRNSGTFQMLKPSTIKPDQSLRPVVGLYERRFKSHSLICTLYGVLGSKPNSSGLKKLHCPQPTCSPEEDDQLLNSSEFTLTAWFTLQAKWPNQNFRSEKNLLESAKQWLFLIVVYFCTIKTNGISQVHIFLRQRTSRNMDGVDYVITRAKNPFLPLQSQHQCLDGLL